MTPVFQQLLVLMLVVWSAAAVLQRLGLPTVMGELLLGVLVGPAVLGWVGPTEIVETLAELGIFFLMLHTGVTTGPREFFRALRASLGVAIVGALVPFGVSFGIALAFGLSAQGAVFVGLTMTATAVVVTLRILKDLGLQDTRVARIIVASCVIDDLFALVGFGVAIGLMREGALDAASAALVAGKAVLYLGVVSVVGVWVVPRLAGLARRGEGRSLTFVLILALSFGLLAEAIGLHVILGAYFAGLFVEKELTGPAVYAQVSDRLDGIAYSFLGPIFFISLGFHVSADAFSLRGLGFVAMLTSAVAVGQILSAGGMARRLSLSWPEAITVGVGMCGRAEMAFVLASLGLTTGALDAEVFSVLVLTAFVLNLVTPAGLKACSNWIAASQE